MRDAIHRDAALGVLHCERLGELNDRSLARRVVGTARKPAPLAIEPRLTIRPFRLTARALPLARVRFQDSGSSAPT